MTACFFQLKSQLADVFSCYFYSLKDEKTAHLPSLFSIVLLDSLRTFPVNFSNRILSQNCCFLLSFKKVQNNLRTGGCEGNCGCVESLEKKKDLPY